MSAMTAIAAVTYVLKDILDNGASDLPPIGSPLKVSVLPPDRVESDSGSKTRLNLFLYQVTPNQGWRNVDLPSRSATGDAVSNPPLALDLHFLLTAYGAADFNAEVLLGYAAQLMHANSVLTRAEIRNSLNAAIAPHEYLKESRLAEQIELIKLTPDSLSTDEMSKLWTSLQGKYRPSLSYRASVVLIESTATVRSPLPVLTRGVDDRGALVNVGLDSPYPALTEIITAFGGSAASPGEQLTLSGRNLGGTGITVQLRSQVHSISEEVSSFVSTSSEAIVLTIPGGATTLRVGIYTVDVRLTQSGVLRSTNALPLLIAPTIDTIVPATVSATTTFTVTTTPAVQPEQLAVLIVGDREIPANAHAASTQTLTFVADDLATGAVLPVRLRIDGMESTLVDRNTTPPQFITTVSIP